MDPGQIAKKNRPGFSKKKNKRPAGSTIGILLSVIFLLPFFVQIQPRGLGVKTGFLNIFAGDPPHYMIMVSSLQQDGDFSLANNYHSAREGSLDAGRVFRGRLLGHHTVFVDRERKIRIEWARVFPPGSLFFTLWQSKDPRDRALRQEFIQQRIEWARDKYQADIRNLPEMPYHPPGLPLLAALATYPIKSSPLREQGVILFIALVSLAGGVFAYLACRRIFPETALLAVAVTYLGTPLWHYSFNFFPEACLGAFVSIAFYLILTTLNLDGNMPDKVSIKKENRDLLLVIVAGIIVGMGLTMKLPFGLVAISFVILLLMFRKNISRPWIVLGLFTVPVILFVVGLMWYNHASYGGPLTLAQEGETGRFSLNPGRILQNLVFMAFHPQRGMMLLSPMLILIPWGLVCLHKKHPLTVKALLLTAVPYGLLFSLYALWEGGYCYGVRHLVPLLPLMTIPMGCLFDDIGLKFKNTWKPYLLSAPVLFSLISGFISAFFFYHMWDYTPWQVLRIISGI